MKTFDNLAQRGIYCFLSTMPNFNAVKSQYATTKEQENAYNFIRNIYEKIYDNPELLNFKIFSDDCFLNWWNIQKEKPGLTEKIRGYIKHINAFIESLYSIVYLGQSDSDKITVNKNIYDVKPVMLKKLRNFNITIEKGEDNHMFTFPQGTVKGLKLLALISNEYSYKSATKIHNHSFSVSLLFSRGVFNPEAPYTAEIFRGIIEYKEPFDKLIDYYSKNNYIRVDNKERKEAMNGDIISLDYVKFYGKPEGIIGYAWKTNIISGISFMYNEAYQSLMKIGVHIPFFREVISNYEKMSESLKQWIPHFCKCSGCRDCVRTDKSRTKPIKFIKAGDNNLCPTFTFGFTFNHLNSDMWLVDGIIELMEFVDVLFSDRRVEVNS